MHKNKRHLNVLLAKPRGFCAGVERAIQIVEKSLKKYGAPVYVRHEIVHNTNVVNDLKKKGAVFVEELDEIPETKQPIIFSAHGVPKIVPENAKNRNLFHIDATCPLVSKVHIEAEKLYRNDFEIILIGHQGHPEVIGTTGQLPNGKIKLIETIKDAELYKAKNPDKLSYITQTTLSVDDTEEIVKCLKKRYPNIIGPHKEDICYATTNRQNVVKKLSPHVDMLFVVGSKNSSNSQRLVEVGIKSGCKESYLIEDENEIKWDLLGKIENLAITAGASAPEKIVQKIIETLSNKFDVNLKSYDHINEDGFFKLPVEFNE